MTSSCQMLTSNAFLSCRDLISSCASLFRAVRGNDSPNHLYSFTLKVANWLRVFLSGMLPRNLTYPEAQNSRKMEGYKFEKKMWIFHGQPSQWTRIVSTNFTFPMVPPRSTSSLSRDHLNKSVITPRSDISSSSFTLVSPTHHIKTTRRSFWQLIEERV